MARALVLHAGESDPVAEILDGHPDVELLHVDAILPYMRAEPWPLTASLQAPKELLEKFAGRVVFNRVFNLAGTETKAFLKAHGYHDQWAYFLLDDLLGRSARLIHGQGPRGVSRSLMPLPTQWHMVSANAHGLKIPEYEYVFGGAPANLAAFHDPMQKSVWSLYHWRQEQHLPLFEENWHRFHVERPLRASVLGWYVGAGDAEGPEIGLTFPRGDAALENAEAASIADMLARSFDSLIGEFVVYVEPDGTRRFYAFSPYMRGAQSHPDFAHRLSRWCDKLKDWTGQSALVAAA